MTEETTADRTVRDAEGGRGGGATTLPRDPALTRRTHRGRWLIGVIALLAACGLAARGIVQREDNVTSLQTVADDEAIPKVTLVQPKPGPGTRTLTLPGQTQAWFQAPIFAQVTGYISMWSKDIGAEVKKGELLATIETPDLDQELQQARAQLAVAQARAALARVTAARWQKLAGTQAVSQEAVDVNTADAREAQSEVQAAQYNVARFEAQEAFKRVVAPFDGVVTARFTDIGNFVNANGGTAQQQGRSQELFTVSDVHEIRVFVSVPQDYSGVIKPGATAHLTMPQFPNKTFDAVVATTARAFDSNTRTVVTELTMPNPDQTIWPGGYAQVTFTVPSAANILVIPEQAMLFRAQGLEVAVVGKDSRVHLQTIQIGLNLGDTVQVTGGLSPGDNIVANPSEGLLDGQQVQVVHPPPQNSDDDGETASAAPKPGG